MTESQFSGRVALVTGGSSGIGQATAVAFAREGATVVVADISADEGVATLSQIKELGGETAYVRADVTQASEVESLIKRIYEMYGRLDFAHNNAGSGNAEHGLASTAKTSEDAFDKMIALNIKGVFLCMKYELLAMLPARRGVIVNTASIAGMAGVPGNAVYSACKHAVVGLTKSAAVEYASRGIRINALCPGTTRTPLSGRLHNQIDEDRSAAMHPMNRLGLADEQAAGVIFLCSDAASFVTGIPLPVDGGAVARCGIG